ncbi:MAG: hypothetical protein R2748_20000 [Bryobacterales bacterium]
MLQGASILSNLSQVGRATYNQTFDTGTQFQTSYSTNRSSNNSAFTTFNPSVTQGLQVQVTQPLLRDRGRGVQRLPFLISPKRGSIRRTRRVQQQIIQLLLPSRERLLEVISQRENLRVRENSVDVNRAFLERSRRSSR